MCMLECVLEGIAYNFMSRLLYTFFYTTQVCFSLKPAAVTIMMYFELCILNCWNYIILKVPSQPSYSLILSFARSAKVTHRASQLWDAVPLNSAAISEYFPNINPSGGKT